MSQQDGQLALTYSEYLRLERVLFTEQATANATQWSTKNRQTECGGGRDDALRHTAGTSTLYQALAEPLGEGAMRARDLADYGNELGIYTRLDGRVVPTYQVASTVHSYREDFDVRDGVVTLRAALVAHTALRGVTEKEKTIAALPVPTDSELRPWRGIFRVVRSCDGS